MRLLHLLLSYFLFCGTMFAAGAPVLGAGGGAGDSGGGDGGDSGGLGDGGDGISSDSDALGDGAEGTEGAEDVAAADRDADGAEGGEDQNALTDLGDGRKVPAKWKNLFEQAKAAGLDRELKQLYFSAQRLTSKFPGGVKQAIELAGTLEEYGGLDGIAQLKGEVEGYQQDHELLSSDPAKWVAASFEDNPEAAIKAFTQSLDYMGQNHGEMYDHLMAKVVFNTVSGDSSPITEIYHLLAGIKDNPQAQEAAKKLAGWYNGIRKTGEKVPEKQIDPQRKALDDREAKLNDREQSQRNEAVNRQTIPQLGKAMTAGIEKEAKAAGYDLKKFQAEQPGAYKSLRSEILTQVMNKAASDATFVKNYKAVLATGDTARAVAMMNKKHDGLLPDIVASVAKDWGIAKKAGVKPGGKPRPAVNNGGGDGTTKQLAAKPNSNLIDWARTGTRIYDGQAYLKSGELVSWP